MFNYFAKKKVNWFKETRKMYSIFSTKSKKLKYLEEGEPPPKKIITEGDTLIKKLAENQLKTNITLTDHLNQTIEFTSSERLTGITGYIRGNTDLHNFQSSVTSVNEENKLKSKGLDDMDIKIYRDYLNLGTEFWVKYKANKDTLQQRLHEILQIVSRVDNSKIWAPAVNTSRHEEDYLNSLKPQSVETKLLRFAAQNKSNNHQLPSPMDEMPDLEKRIMHDLEEFSKCDIKKIRKRARSLGNKIQELKEAVISPKEKVEKRNLLQRKTLWDVKEKPAHLVKKLEIMDKDKVYTCKPQNWYTIKDGRIIKLNEDKAITHDLTQNDHKKFKLTIEEIKNIPKFSNYEAGSPARKLFLKNLGKNVTEDMLRNILTDFSLDNYSIKIMNGKMKGQAFVEFQDESRATDALEILNGMLVEGRPIIAQFGKNKCT